MKALITGGGGFLGTAIAKKLRARGDEVVSLNRGAYPHLAQLGVDVRQGDMCAEGVVQAAAEGCEVIFHVAARPGSWGSWDSFYQPNVVGTRRVLEACDHHGIGKLVYTSSPSVVHGEEDIEGADESLPYPEHYEAFYPQTKAIAEQEVMAANGSTLSTVSLRPHLIWGPDDNQLIPRIIDRARTGQLRLIGEPKLIDTIYVDNAADAHVAAADRLTPDSPVAGSVYFLSNDEPISSHDMINRIIGAAGLPPCTRVISARLARFAGGVFETAWKVLGRTDEPRMTRFVAAQLSTAHWYDISAAKRDLGYAPAVSIDEGLDRLKAWFDANPVST